MAYVELLLYPEDFADPAPRPAPPPAPAEPVFTAADVAAARAEGFASGAAAGRTEAALQQQARVAEALGRVAERLDAAADAAMAAAEAHAQALAQVLVDALRAAFPTLSAQHGAAEMRRVIAAILPALARETAVTLHVPPALEAAARSALQALALRRATPPRIVPDARLQPGDIEIAWDDGRAVRDGAAVWRDVLAALAPLRLSAEMPTSPAPTE